MRYLILAAALLPFPAAAQAGPATLSLVCAGGGNANKATHHTVSGWNSSGDYASGTVTGTRSVGFGDQISIRIDGDVGQVRMPRSMLPALHGGDDGWFKLKNIKVTDGEITASVAVNPLNSPKLRLDRYTGAVSLSGKSGDFAGQCQKFDPATAQRQF